MNFDLKIIETPRDAFQGIKQFIPTESKIRIINSLLKVGFDTVEVGSYVSEEAIPQMADTAEVMKGLDIEESKSRIMVLVGNKRGGLEAVQRAKGKGQSGGEQGSREAGKQGGVDDILYPFSVSPAFLKRNLNSGMDRAKGTILDLMEICDLHKKRLIVYLTMAFGNPYGDKWDPGIVEEFAGYLYELGHRIIPLSDILGEVEPKVINRVYSRVLKTFPDVEFGFHLHSRKGGEFDRIDAAWQAGVRRFDTVTGGFGGCPMADDHLVGNLDTFALIDYCDTNRIEHGLDTELLGKVRDEMAEGIGNNFFPIFTASKRNL